VVPHLDKVVHFFVFGMVAWLLDGAISAHYKSLKSDFLVVCISIVLVALLGVGDEWIQSFTRTRHAEVDDVLADVAGGVVFLLIYLRFKDSIFSKKEGHDSQVVSDV
jgi:VanZ family protein